MARRFDHNKVNKQKAASSYDNYDHGPSDKYLKFVQVREYYQTIEEQLEKNIWPGKGKHFGKQIHTLTNDYLIWAGQHHPNKKLLQAANRELIRRHEIGFIKTHLNSPK